MLKILMRDLPIIHYYVTGAVLALVVSGCLGSSSPKALSDSPLLAASPNVSICPAGLPGGAKCFTGVGDFGAPYLIAMPSNWNGKLFLFARGATPIPLKEARALGAAHLLLPEGYAVAASQYRAAYLLAAVAAEDTENLRQIFIRAFGQPKRTFLHGNSFGGLVAARIAELYAKADDSINYHGVCSSCGVVAGQEWNMSHRLDLRVVYQYYCRNHPRSDEQQYPLYLGLAPGIAMTNEELQKRVNECTGIMVPAEKRSQDQRQKLANILNVIRIPEDELLNHMRAATFNMGQLVQLGLRGRNPFSNIGVNYRASDNDQDLNKSVLRYNADPAALAYLSSRDDPTGKVSIPVLTIHAVNDGRVFVEQQAAYRATFKRAKTLDHLFQAYTNKGEHCRFTNTEFVTMFYAMMNWVETGLKPTQGEILKLCEQVRQKFPSECRFNPAFEPGSLDKRIYSRKP